MSTNRVCGLLHLALSNYYHPHGRRDEAPVSAALQRHAAVAQRWRHRRLLVLPRREGIAGNHKRVQRLYRTKGLKVRRRKQPRVAPAHHARRPHARVLWIDVDTSLSGPRVARVLNYLSELRSRPPVCSPTTARSSWA